jgi:hypothetical protein
MRESPKILVPYMGQASCISRGEFQIFFAGHFAADF